MVVWIPISPPFLVTWRWHMTLLLLLLTCPGGLHGFPWVLAVFWNSVSFTFLQVDRAQAIYGEKSLLWTLTTNIFYTGSYSGGNLGGFSRKKKHESWDLQWIIEAKIPSYEILSQASVGETLNATSFTFPDPLRSWLLVSICTSKKTSRLFFTL